MSDLDDLYQEVIIDHARHPRNQGAMPGETHWSRGHNPLCGDSIVVHLMVKGDIVEAASFEGTGCAISVASASMMTEAVRGKTVEEARELFQDFRGQLVDEDAETSDLGDLESLTGVRNYPMRVKCATLAWHTLGAALDQPGGTISTE